METGAGLSLVDECEGETDFGQVGKRDKRRLPLRKGRDGVEELVQRERWRVKRFLSWLMLTQTLLHGR